MIKYTKKPCQYFLASFHPYETMMVCSRIWIMFVSVNISVILRTFAKPFCTTVFFSIDSDHATNLLRRITNRRILDHEIGMIHFNIISSMIKNGYRTIKIRQPIRFSKGTFCSGLNVYNNIVQKFAREILKRFAQSVKK